MTKSNDFYAENRPRHFIALARGETETKTLYGNTGALDDGTGVGALDDGTGAGALAVGIISDVLVTNYTARSRPRHFNG